MFNQIKVGGTEKDFHDLPICLAAMLNAVISHGFSFIINIIQNAIGSNTQRITRVAFEFFGIIRTRVFFKRVNVFGDQTFLIRRDGFQIFERLTAQLNLIHLTSPISNLSLLPSKGSFLP